MIYISLNNYLEKNNNNMVDHLIKKKPLKLYYQNNNFQYTFLNSFDDYYDINYYYNLLNYTDLKNILYTIYLNWHIYLKKHNIQKNNIIYMNYDCDPSLFNNILLEFINNEYSMSIFCINNIIKYYL